MATAPIRVVLVDDDDALATLLEANFELDDRFQLIGRARNGMEALEVVPKLAPDAVLMDLHMPLLGGLAAMKALMHENPDACVIVFTASNDPAEHEAARSAGAIAVLPKPFDPAAFLDVFDQHARGCASHTHAAA